MKFDYESEEILDILSPISDLISHSGLIIDQLNEDNFLFYTPFSFAIGNLANNKIVLSPHRQFNPHLLICSKLIGDQMHGFDARIRDNAGNRSIPYCKIDLITLKKETINVPLVLNNGCVLYNLEVDI